jgi:hypothetical protein
VSSLKAELRASWCAVHMAAWIRTSNHRYARGQAVT